MPDNIEEFNKCAAVVLNYLYERFPLDSEIVLGRKGHLDPSISRYCYFGTVEFLKNEGYIRFKTTFREGFTGVVLTAKGLSILNSIPENLEKKTKISEKIKGAIKSGTEEAYRIAVQEFIKIGLNL